MEGAGSRTKPDRPILIVAQGYGVAGGGVERYVERLATGLVARGVEVEVAAPDPTRVAPPHEMRDGVAIHRFAAHGRDGSMIPSPRMVAWLMGNARHFALMNAHNLHTWLPAATNLAARRAGVPFVLTSYWHGTGHTSLARLLHIPYRPLARLTARSAATVICNSSAERRLVSHDFGRVRTRVIPVGIDLPEIGARLRAAAPDGWLGTTILAVGRLEQYKGIERVIAALAHLPGHYRLVLVGDGSARSGLEAAAASAGVSGRVVFAGHCTDDEVLAWRAHAAACVSLSARESFGLAVLEALAAGCPVLASDIDAHRELLSRVPSNRLLLVSRDSPPEEIAAGLESAVTTGRIDPAGAQAAGSWRLPTWDQLTDEVLDVFRDALVRHAAAAAALPRTRPPRR